MDKASFALFKEHQYCDNEKCSHYGQVGAGNLRTHSTKSGQVQCNKCKSGPFSVRKGTMFFNLRTPIDKIIKVLSLLSRGIGVNSVCEEQNVTSDSVSSWITLAANHVESFTAYMQKDMHLEQVQIDEFWSFIRKKRNI